METTLNVITIVTSIVNSVALLIGGIWAFNNFIRSRAGVWNLNIQVAPETIEVEDGRKLLVINVHLRNIGNVKIVPGPSGCVVKVIPIITNTEEVFSEIKADTSKIIYQEDILKKYYRPKIGYNNYEIEPNSEYHEEICLLVEEKNIFEIQVEFFYKQDKDSITESNIYSIQ